MDLFVSRVFFGFQKDEDFELYFFNYEDSVGGKYQVWFDNFDSLKIKYDFVVKENLIGIVIWNVDLLDYSDILRVMLEIKKMWDVLYY